MPGPRRSLVSALLLVALIAFGAAGCVPEASTEETPDNPVGGVGEGSIASPVPLTMPMSYGGTVGANGNSYYVITSVPTNPNGFSADLLVTSDVDLHIYSNSGFTTVVCASMNTGVTTENCPSQVSFFDTLYIRVPDMDGVGGNYTLIMNDYFP